MAATSLWVPFRSRGHLAEFGGGIGLDRADLLAELLIALLLIFLDGLRETAARERVRPGSSRVFARSRPAGPSGRHRANSFCLVPRREPAFSCPASAAARRPGARCNRVEQITDQSERDHEKQQHPARQWRSFHRSRLSVRRCRGRTHRASLQRRRPRTTGEIMAEVPLEVYPPCAMFLLCRTSGPRRRS